MFRLRLQAARCLPALGTSVAFRPRFYSSYESQVAAGAGDAAPSASSAAGGAAKGPEDTSHITRQHVWGLWNEGNLFSLSVAELSAFLKHQCSVEVDPKAKKSALVRQVEEIMSAEQPSLVNEEETGTSPAGDEYSTQGSDLYEEADVYGDWGAEPGFDDKKQLDYMELALSSMSNDAIHVCAPRAFQLLHNETTADVALQQFNPTKLPGCADMKAVYSPRPISSDDANRIRFRKSFHWAVTNLWNMNMDGELNIGAGKALYWRGVAKHNRNVLPLWTCQQHLHLAHPYSWFAVAHETNVAPVIALAEQMGMQPSQEAETSYKVCVKRSKDQLDLELNSQLQCTLVNRPWDRFLMTHVLRTKMPDLRYLIRARTPLKKKVADSYFENEILKLTRDSVHSVLSPELGEVQYCAERVIRKWATRLECGVTLSLVETRRTPLIVTRQGEEGERLEYELISSLPMQAERVDIRALSDELWSKGNEFAAVLEEGMTNLQAHTMPSSAAFDSPV